MAQPGGTDAHQHLALAGRIEIHFLDPERPRVRVWPGATDLPQDGGAYFHARENTARGRPAQYPAAAGPPAGQAVLAASAGAASLSSRRRILPTLLFGSWPRNSMTFGFL